MLIVLSANVRFLLYQFLKLVFHRYPGIKEL